MLALALSLAAVVAFWTRTSGASDTAACSQGRAPTTTLIIDGDLYAVVRGPRGRYLFGSSGKPVLSFGEALRLIRALRFKGTTATLLHMLEREGIPGGAFDDGGGASDFTFTCRGVYRATAVVRAEGGAITATRFWLQQGEQPSITRAFCMPEQWVPARALVSVTFRVPLAAASPVFTIDWDGNGKLDSLGPFRPGGAGFPASDRC